MGVRPLPTLSALGLGLLLAYDAAERRLECLS
jgi:hypothetical protein